jgi:hypothetical protein
LQDFRHLSLLRFRVTSGRKVAYLAEIRRLDPVRDHVRIVHLDTATRA